MDRVRVRVRDKRVCALVKAFLKSGVLTELGDREETHTGTPQGGIISPLMANIALSALDDHFDQQWKHHMPTEYQRAKRRRNGKANYKIIRLCRGPGYADPVRRLPGQGGGWVLGIGITCGFAGDLPVWFVSVVPPDGEMIMEMGVDAGCVPAGGGSAGLLTEFRTWLDRERGLAPVSVRCYSKQAKAFLAAIGGPGAVSGLDAGQVTAFMVGHCRDRNTWSAKAMVTSLRAFLRFAHATGRTTVPLGGAVPVGRVVAAVRAAARPAGGRDRAPAGRV